MMSFMHWPYHRVHLMWAKVKTSESAVGQCSPIWGEPHSAHPLLKVWNRPQLPPQALLWVVNHRDRAPILGQLLLSPFLLLVSLHSWDRSTGLISGPPQAWIWVSEASQDPVTGVGQPPAQDLVLHVSGQSVGWAAEGSLWTGFR